MGEAKVRAENVERLSGDDELGKHASRFVAKVADRTAVVGILGLGYVGLPLALAFFKEGFDVIGFDVDARKIEKLEASKTYIKHIPDERIAEMRDAGKFQATTDFSRLAAVDAIVICVPTPLTVHREPDMSYVVSTAETIAPNLRRGQLVTLESTTYPFTSEDLLRNILEKGSGLKADEDFAIAYSPEREDPANPQFDTQTIPKVVGAGAPQAADMAEALYAAIVGQIVRVKSMRVAEAVKLTENIFRSVNIALVNELKIIFDKMGIDVWEVIDAAATKPFGFMPFYPGPGIGGHCIPIDPFYLTWKAREFGVSTRFIELAGEINSHMPAYAVQRTSDAMNDRLAKALKNSRILIVGLAYKKNVDDMRESPSIHLIERFREKGAFVEYYDPFVPEVPDTRGHEHIAGMKSVAWDRDALKSFDAAIIATDHSDVDYLPLLEELELIVDTRNALKAFHDEFSHKIVKG
ncbi:nucleotide sugar dehydrogenase [Aliihoeflea aestuarii]|jgi:UDP-N-acetyl-D-glucosamine dehydrogenase|uniref:nucleotide sugar dehydrogenase n=1 Tax=Aliihoeflea aestuarii TaxID=453840 RepID=UPI002093974C|nr:nucleotide sugar dehydrogenase [Aliihoeflea aestuarii]MCO6390170.1 nucleotide sugar dehydrogenase [Aliihoeflea aestuarii]